jgi:hypothetical protein
MKARIIAAVSMAALASATPALADDTTQPTTTTTTPAPMPAPAPAPVPVTGTTTTTAADANESVTPIAPPADPSAKETVTLYQKNRPSKALLMTGGLIFAGTYATSVAIVAANTESNDKSMYIPVVGPWLALKDADYSTSKTLLYGASGVLQGAGIGLAIASFFIPEKTAAVTIQAKNVKMNVLPTSYGVGSAGLGAVGTF